MKERKKGTDHPPEIQARRAALGVPDEDAVYSLDDLELAEKMVACARRNPSLRRTAVTTPHFSDRLTK
jgi:hypothetical protein